MSGPFTNPAFLGSAALGLKVANGNLSGGRFVHLESDGTIIYADGPGGIEAHGFISAAVEDGASVMVFGDGRLNGLSGLTQGIRYFLGTDGALVAEPSMTSGAVIQSLGLGTDATILEVEIDTFPVYS